MKHSLSCCDNPQLRWRGTDPNILSIECQNCGFILSDDGQLADWHNPEEIEAAKQLALEECVSEMVCQQCGQELDSEHGLSGRCPCLCHEMV